MIIVVVIFMKLFLRVYSFFIKFMIDLKELEKLVLGRWSFINTNTVRFLSNTILFLPTRFA